MNESPTMAIDALKIITEFLSNNSLTIVFLVLLIICKDAISGFISRLTSVKYKTGESELGMEAAAPSEKKENSSDLRMNGVGPTQLIEV